MNITNLYCTSCGKETDTSIDEVDSIIPIPKRRGRKRAIERKIMLLSNWRCRDCLDLIDKYNDMV